MPLQYYNVGGTYYSLDKSSGKAAQVSSIPAGGATITWNGQGLPPDLQSALGQPASSTPAVSPTVSNATPTYGAVNTSPNVAEPGQSQAIASMPAYTAGDLPSLTAAVTYLGKNAKTAADYNMLAQLQQQVSQEQTRQQGITTAAQQLINSGAGSVAINNYYAGLSTKDQSLVSGILGNAITPGYQVPNTSNTKSTVTGAGISTPTSTIAPTTTAPATTVAPTVAPASASTTSNAIPTTAPGSTATNLSQYYTALGQTLPTVAARAATYASVTGNTDTYTGSATQNEALLEGLQRQDYAKTTIGSPATAGGPAAINTTPAGTALAAALSGSSASSTIDNYKAYLTSALGAATDKLNADTTSLNNFFSTAKSATDILNDAMDAAGIPQQRNLLSQLDSTITDQTALLKKLPDDIKDSLADVGVTQAQLDRIVANETKGPTDALNDLLTQRNATADEINTATSFAEKFADTQLSDQAAKLSALEWMVTSDKGDYNNLEDDVKSVIQQSISDQKDIMDTALTVAKNGASQDTINAVLAAPSPAAAISAAGSTLVTPKTTSATTGMTTDINSASSALEIGDPTKGYNGRGPDGYVDPNLYVALYNAAQTQYGPAGAAAFIAKYPPAKDINPANIGTGRLPAAVENAVKAAQSKSSGSGASSGIVIDQAAIQAALAGAK